MSRLARPSSVILAALLAVGCAPSDRPEAAGLAIEPCRIRDLPAAPQAPAEILASDRVGFPVGYRDTFVRFYIFDRFDAGQISIVCANDAAAGVAPGEPFPYGSVLLSEGWRPLVDEAGAFVLDAQGRLVPGQMTGVFVMRKEEGFGGGYGPDRSGEWEYVAYRPDGTYLTPPENSASCAACHNVGVAPELDYVFRTHLHHLPGRYARTDPLGEGEIGISRMSFQPGTRTVEVGTTVTWRNSTIDNTLHSVGLTDGSIASEVLAPGETFSHTFTEPGRYEYVCPLHPVQMRGVIEVTPADG